MRNPRRDAVEYAMLIAISSSMAVAFSIMLCVDYRSDENGQKQKIDFREPKAYNSSDAAKEFRRIRNRVGRGGSGGNGNDDHGPTPTN